MKRRGVGRLKSPGVVPEQGPQSEPPVLRTLPPPPPPPSPWPPIKTHLGVLSQLWCSVFSPAYCRTLVFNLHQPPLHALAMKAALDEYCETLLPSPPPDVDSIVKPQRGG